MRFVDSRGVSVGHEGKIKGGLLAHLFLFGLLVVHFKFGFLDLEVELVEEVFDCPKVIFESVNLFFVIVALGEVDVIFKFGFLGEKKVFDERAVEFGDGEGELMGLVDFRHGVKFLSGFLAVNIIANGDTCVNRFFHNLLKEERTPVLSVPPVCPSMHFRQAVFLKVGSEPLRECLSDLHISL